MPARRQRGEPGRRDNGCLLLAARRDLAQQPRFARAGPAGDKGQRRALINERERIRLVGGGGVVGGGEVGRQRGRSARVS